MIGENSNLRWPDGWLIENICDSEDFLPLCINRFHNLFICNMGLVARKSDFVACEQQMRSLISAFIIRPLDSIIAYLALWQKSIFQLVSVAE